MPTAARAIASASPSGARPPRQPARTVCFDGRRNDDDDGDDDHRNSRNGDRIMTAEEYKPLAKQIAKALRMPSDPPPRPMAQGRGPWNQPCRNVSTLFEAHASSGAVLVRGFRLLMVSIEGDDQPRWKAVFHLVVAHPPKDATKSNKWIYECATAYEDTMGRASQDFIFVPSSRAHTELTDEQLLSGEWLLGMVIGGQPVWCAHILADNAARGGRLQGLVGTSPEQCVARRRMLFGHFPHFESWYQQKKRAFTLDCLAEIMGFPCIDVAERAANPGINFFDEQHVHASIANNEKALVNGGERCNALTLETERALLAGEETVASVVARFRRQYDELLREVETVRAKRYESHLASVTASLLLPPPRTGPGGRLWAPSREDVLRDLALGA